jgi:hypothetical protein
MEDAYRQALRQMVEQARVTDSDIALGHTVLAALLNENDQLRRDRGALVSAMKKVLSIIDQGDKWKDTVERIAVHAHSVLVLFERAKEQSR